MGTEVLRPRDVLIEGFLESPVDFHQRRGSVANVVVSRKQTQSVGSKKATKPDRKKTSASPEHGATKRARKGPALEGRKKEDGGGFVMGKVTLLRRGESLDSLASKIKVGRGCADSKPESPEIVMKQIRLCPPPALDVYAGSAFYSSPSPRSVPLPSFFNRKTHEMKPLADSASEDLRRLLRLDNDVA